MSPSVLLLLVITLALLAAVLSVLYLVTRKELDTAIEQLNYTRPRLQEAAQRGDTLREFAYAATQRIDVLREQLLAAGIPPKADPIKAPTNDELFGRRKGVSMLSPTEAMTIAELREVEAPASCCSQHQHEPCTGERDCCRRNGSQP